ncbi:MAG: 2-C-methyl-D-erythritol 2,4-cyclodiphosphate synthase [Candidatus Aenigmatarchaeota archaeon]
MLVGIGLDSHEFEEDSRRPLVLGGIEIEGEPKLKAHSDGDVILHSLFNAISSALGNRSIGYYHSDKIEEKRGISSTKYMETVKEMMKKNEVKLKNISIAIEAKRPKLEKHIPKMKGKIAEIFDLERSRIGITATSGEKLTAFGRGKGIKVISTVSLENKY